MKNDNGYKGNMWDRLGGMRVQNFYTGKVVDGEWHDPSVNEVKGSFKLHLLIIAAGLIIGTVVNFNYLGGIEGILTSEMLGYGKESLPSYIAAIGSLIVMPTIAIACLISAFKKPKK